MLFGNRLRLWVDDTLETSEFSDYFQDLRGRLPELDPFVTVQDLLDVLKPKSGTFKERDELLVALIREHQEAPTSNLNALFLAIFRPVLVRLFRTLLKGTSDADGLWNDLTWALLSEVSDYPLASRTFDLVNIHQNSAVCTDLRLQFSSATLPAAHLTGMDLHFTVA